MAKQYSVTVNGNVYDVTVEEIGNTASHPAAPVQQAAPAPAAPVSTPAAAPAPVPAAAPASVQKSAIGTGEPVAAPLNGTVLDVKVKNGDAVKSGDVICVLEAMKMENDIVAPKSGTISSVLISKGDNVNPGDTLVTIA